jgi:creatinine amidohydrolase
MRPDLVDMAKAEDFRSAQESVVDGSGRLGYHMMGANIAWVSEDLNPKGAVGNAAAATAERGEADLSAMVEGFVALMHDLNAMPRT